MMFHAILPSVAYLLLLASQVSQTSGAALSEEAVHMMNRRDWYNAASAGALDFHRIKSREFDEELEQAEKLGKREDYDFHPSRMWGNINGYHSFSATKGCGLGNSILYWGTLIRTITFMYQGRRQYEYWQNNTWFTSTTPIGTPKVCYRWGRPTWNYHSSTTINEQCQDKIYTTSGNLVPRTSANEGSYYQTNSNLYGGQPTRQIYDCLLNRTAREYKNAHPQLGFRPVQYELDGFRYYRFYDDNNFAWFLGCPPEWAVKKQKRGCFGCSLGGNNPIWDFLPEQLHNPLADSTPLEWFSGNISEYSFRKVNVVSYWPQKSLRNVTVEGRKCMQVAVSRPGLRHWTVRFFDEPEMGFVQKTSEWNYPGPWLGISGEGTSKSYEYYDD